MKDDQQAAEPRRRLSDDWPMFAGPPAPRAGMLESISPLLRPQQPCLLPGCGKPTNHHGGYCCADHCREHRRMQRERTRK